MKLGRYITCAPWQFKRVPRLHGWENITILLMGHSNVVYKILIYGPP